MKENRLLFTNALIVLPTETIKGSLAVEDGKITGIFESGTELPGFTEVDVHGKALMPGAIDTHVHMWDPSPLNYREDWACGSQCAASGGITTIIDMPYGNVHYDVVDETIPLHAENPYGATKVACEELVRNYGLDSVSLRVGFVYGPGRVNECPVNMILSTLLKEGKVDWDHGSEQMLDFIYIEDCVEAIAKISLADHNPHAEYNIGGGEVIPYTRIIDKARKLFPTAPIHVGPGDLGYDNLGALSVQRAFEDFGWKPRFSIEQGMEQYMNWLKNF